MEKAIRTLGIDIGTASLGWAICEKTTRSSEPELKEYGIMVFPEGIDRDQTGEKPKNQQRRLSRGTRRRYFRRKRRKQALLKLLIQHGLCPLSNDALNRWVKDDIYPDDQALHDWFKLQPFPLRAETDTRPLTAHELGRVIYHMGQRRGFRSNRKGGDRGDQKTLLEGDAKRGIIGYEGEDGTKTLIERHGSIAKAAVYLSTQSVIKPIRKRFVARTDYEKEFVELWSKQHDLLSKGTAEQRTLATKLTNELMVRIGDPWEGIIFFQRPLKSQKGGVGKCRFEPKKSRAPQAALLSEVFEIQQTVNNIKVGGADLSTELRDRVVNELFLKKDRFTAEDLNKALEKWGVEGESNYAGAEAKNVKFKGAVAIKDLASLFSKDKKETPALARIIFDNPEDKQWLDRWAVIRDAENNDDITKDKEQGRDVGRKRDLYEYAKTQWGFNDEKLKQLMKQPGWPQGYASLSSKAMRKMLPWLKEGIIFSHAAFLANIDEAFGERWKHMDKAQRDKVANGIRAIIDSIRVEKGRVELLNGLIKQHRRHWETNKTAGTFWTNERRTAWDKTFDDWSRKELGDQLGDNEREELRKELLDQFETHVDTYGAKGPFVKQERIDGKIKNYLIEQWRVDPAGVERLYHPSDLELYPKAKGEKLGSPFHPALKNPVAVRAMHALRLLVNSLIGSGAIDLPRGTPGEEGFDPGTRMRVELARQLNSANERRAIQRYQSYWEGERTKAKEELKKMRVEATEDAIEKMLLYMEAAEVFGKAMCPYTGRGFETNDLFGPTPQLQVDHIWPHWRSLDDSLKNKVLCDGGYNHAKGNKIPAECENWERPKVYHKTEGIEVETSILKNAERYKEQMEHYKMLVEKRKQDSKNATDPTAKSNAIADKLYYGHHYGYWKAKYDRLTLEAIPLTFTNRQAVEVGMISRYTRAYLRSLFPQVDSIKGTLVETMRREWLGNEYEEKNPKSPEYRTSHFHHLVDAIVLASTNKAMTDELGHQLKEKEESGGKKKVKQPWTGFSKDVLALKNKVLVYHYHVDPLGRTSRYRVKVNGKQRIVTGSTVRGGLHKDTFYGRILKKNEVGVYMPRIVLRSALADLKPGDVGNIVDKKLRDRIALYGLERAQAEGGYRWEITRKDGTKATHIVRKVRLFDRLDQPLEIKAHRDRVAGREHKHHLLAANEDNHFMGVYENEKGDRTFQILNLFELTQALREGRRKDFPHGLLPQYVEREVRGKKIRFDLLKRNGKPVMLQKDQMVLLTNDREAAESVAWGDTADLSARLYKIRSMEGDGRVMLMHHLEARAASKVDKASEFVKEVTDKRVRLSLNNLNGLFEGIDFRSHPNEVVVPIR